ncbi:hypothetical protein AM233_10140 [Bacillus sp. FJAT-22058]|nr:hypothetical protein AM233_10140 [Bacillus sp. FJAT-22058]
MYLFLFKVQIERFFSVFTPSEGKKLITTLANKVTREGTEEFSLRFDYLLRVICIQERQKLPESLLRASRE